MKDNVTLRMALFRRLLPCYLILLTMVCLTLCLTRSLFSREGMWEVDAAMWWKSIVPVLVASTTIVALYTCLAFFHDKSHCGGLSITKVSLGQSVERLVLSLIVSFTLFCLLQQFYGLEGNSKQGCILPMSTLFLLSWWFYRHSSHQNVVKDTPESIWCLIAKAWKVSIWHVGGKVSLLVFLTLMVMKFTLNILHNFVMMRGFLQKTSPFFFRLSHACTTSVFTMMAIQQAVVIAFVFTTAVEFAHQLMSFALFHPLDFTKVQFNDVMNLKYPGEHFLLRALRYLHGSKSSITLVQPSSKTKSFLGGSLDQTPMYKKHINHVIEYMEDEVVKGRKAMALGQFPLLSYFVGPNQHLVTSFSNLDVNFALILRSLAFHDLNRIGRIHSMRRQELFDKHWNEIFDACMTNIASFVTQIQLLQIYLREPKDQLKQSVSDNSLPNAASSRESIPAKKAVHEPITFEQLQALRTQFQAGIQGSKSSGAANSKRPVAKDPLETFFEEQIFNRVASFVDGMPPLSDAFNLIEGIPKQSELTNEIESGNSSIGSFLKRFFPSTLSQATVNAVDCLSLFLRHGLKEDHGGRSIHSVPASLYILLKLDMCIQSYTNMLQQAYTARISVGGKSHSQFIRFKLRSGQYLPPEVFALITATKEAILTILRCYSDIVSDDMFPEDVVSSLKFYQNELLEIAN